jgi:uncharacterized protein
MSLTETAETTKVLSDDRTPTPASPAKIAEGTQTVLREGATETVQAEEVHQQPIGLKDIRNNPRVRAYIEKANEQMAVIGYSEHGLRHAALVAAIARNILLELDLAPRAAELAAIAGYLHDIGNCVHRIYHPQIGASMAFTILENMGMEPHEIGTIIGAIGNHEEPEGVPIHEIAAAVIIADKSDVHYTRVQNPDPVTFDIHDRVNNAVQKSKVLIDKELKVVTLDLIIDTKQASVMEYMEIFVSRMFMCRRAANRLGCEFRLVVNEITLT